MRCKTFVVAMMLVGGRLAMAQPTGTGTGSGGVEDMPPTPPPPPPAPTPPPPPPPAEHHHEMMMGDGEARPAGTSFGIGLGYRLPADLQMPNTTSVRVRFMSGLTIEPFAVIATSSHKMDDGTNDSTDSQTDFSVGSLLRFPMVKRGRADFELLGAAALATSKINPEGDDNDTTLTTLALAWGIGIGYWMGPHWQLSLSATNPLISYSKQSSDTPTATVATSNTSFGAIFDPTVTLMVHLYN